MKCNLCFSEQISEFSKDFHNRSYYLCGDCDLVFVKSEDQVAESVEFERY